VQGDTMLCQAVGRHFEPHEAGPQERPVLELAMGYGRTSLSTADAVRGGPPPHLVGAAHVIHQPTL
jgi:hypothetical protein